MKPRLFHLMSLAGHRLLKATDAAFGDAVGIGTTQLGILFILEKNPGTPPKEVSEALGINKSAVTPLIDRMVEAGLVRRAPSEADGRSVQLFATPEGLAKASAARPVLARLNTRLMRGFSARDIAAIERFLTAILDRF